MNGSHLLQRRLFFSTGIALVLLSHLLGCTRTESDRVQGYVEGEFVYIASPVPGTLESLRVRRGDQVEAGDALFALEDTLERSARQEADQRLVQGRANLEDLKKGKRTTEVAAIEAQRMQAQAVLALSEKELARLESLVQSGAAAVRDYDRAHSMRDQDRQRVLQLEADMKTAQLGSRTDQIASAEANVLALEAALAKADWGLAQKQQAGLVFDTFYSEGEWVAAGRPVVALLPPANIKVRAFVSETRLGAIHTGDRVRVVADGRPAPFEGTVSFISPQAEFTPPVIYSRESRAKLVFMIEAVFDPEIAVGLHPGQPVDVQFGF